MNPRREFLTALFRILDERAVPYCVLRNYNNIYDDTSSDVDLAVESEHVLNLKACLGEAAVATNHHFVLRARYVNFSYVYWHPAGGFLRIDMETEVRWRVFPVLTAKSIVTLRRKEGAFYIPHPRHESVILFVAAVWRGNLSERYRTQLARLYRQLADPGELRRTLRSTFGSMGEELAAYQARIVEAPPDRRVWRAAKWALIRNAFRDAPSRNALFEYLAGDVKRLIERLRQPPGISLLYVSSAQSARDMDDFFRRIKFLYPTEKSATHAFRVSPKEGAHFGRLGVRLRAKRLYSLFKGGLFIRSYYLDGDKDIRRLIGMHSRYLYASRTFVWAEDSRFRTCLGHAASGFMADLNPVGGAAVSNDKAIGFISRILEQYHSEPKRESGKQGLFVVLVGLDGSGKTTVARQLCCLGAEESRFRKIRYFHWQPAIIGPASFPLPEHGNLSRKPELRRDAFRSGLSVARLGKNLLSANLAYWLRVRPLLRRNALVLVDRYFYNYFLDPVSVKYYGPAWLLERVRRWFPRPDLVVVLKGPAEVLLARKQELAREEILRQSAILERLRFEAAQMLEVDATEPAEEVARKVWQKIVGLGS